MSGSLRATFAATAATTLIVLSPLAASLRAQTGGFLESATSTAWSNINNHAGSETMLIFLDLDRNRGGMGPSLFSYNKTTGDTRNLGPLFKNASPLSWATGEGWYFSATRASDLNLNDGPRMVDAVTPAPVTWASSVNLSTVNNGLQKISGCDGCPDAKAVSNQTISGVGWAQWSAPEVQTLRVLGLSPNAAVTVDSDIPFAIRLQAGTAEVREMGTYKAETAFVVGDTFRITVENGAGTGAGTVRYQKNGTTFHTSANSATEAMRIHAILYGLDGALGNIVAGIDSASGGGITDTTAPTVLIDSPSGGAVLSDSIVP